MKKVIVMALLPWLALAGAAQAESSAAKKELVAKILQLQQPAIEMAARTLAEQPAAQMQHQAGLALQMRVPADKREAVAKVIQADLKKYVDETVPLMTAQALKIAPLTVGALIDENFSEDELKQLVAIIESPVNRKYAQLGGAMQKSLAERLVADMAASVTPKVQALQLSISKQLGMNPPPSPKTLKK